MLDAGDLSRFLAIFDRAARLDFCGPCRSAEVVLEDANSNLEAREVWHLARAVRVAANLGEAPQHAALLARRLASVLKQGRVARPTSENEWCEAVLWGIRDLAALPDYGANWPREEAVAQACLRLRQQGYIVEVDARGSRLGARSREDLARRMDGLAAVLGGRTVLAQVFRTLRDSDRLHDGHWLFGNQVASVGQSKSPSVPFGWLIALGIKHVRRPGKPNNPAKAWANLVRLATDASSCFDVERYCQFEGIDLRPADLPYLLSESVGWAQLFTQPQSVAQLVPSMRRALRARLVGPDIQALGLDFWDVLAELEVLLGRCEADRQTLIKLSDARRDFPRLVASPGAFPRQANARFLDPFDADTIDHLQAVFFDAGREDLLLLPRSLTAAAAATFVVRRIWDRLPGRRPSKVVGDLFETIIAQACRAKAGNVSADLHYQFGGKGLQIDVAVVEGKSLSLFEVKSKSLTQQARSGDLLKTLEDYGNSYLALVLQLARHEHAIRSGSTSLAKAEESGELDFINVAVSPLTFGPISDRALARPLLSALAVALITPAEGDQTAVQILAKLEKTLAGLIEEVRPLAINSKGELDFHTFLMHFFWLDLGEILYILGRSDRVADAFHPLRYMTFVSRDFWTEVALADRMGLTAKHWRSPAV